MNLSRFALAAAVSLGAASFSFGQVTGSAKLDGKAPEPKPINMAAVADCAKLHADPVMDESIVADDKGALANVVVSITPAEGQALPGAAPDKPAVIDQQGCMYAPHVVAMMSGQTLNIKNSDPFMHNIHSLSEVNPAFNQAQPNKDPKGMDVTNIKSPEYFHVKCDVHGWMSAYVAVFEHPYFAVTGEDGKFSFDAKQVPDGEYTLTAWHETLGKQEQKVNIKDGKGTTDFTFKAPSAQANPIPAVDVKLASLKGEKGCCEADRASLAAAAAKTADKSKTN
jgi:hypothetical protein